MFGSLRTVSWLFVGIGLCSVLAACGGTAPASEDWAAVPTVTMEDAPAPTAEPIALAPTAEPTAEPIAVEPTAEPTVEPTAEPIAVEPIAAAAGRVQPEDGECPAAAPIKGNQDSMIYHVPSGRSYSRTRPEECFATREDAEAAGYRAAKR